jgi:hypothetical protein
MEAPTVATMTKALHAYFDAQLAEASEVLDAGRRSATDTADHLALSAALIVVEGCREAVEMADDTETVSKHLETARDGLTKMDAVMARRFTTARMLIDQAISGTIH